MLVHHGKGPRRHQKLMNSSNFLVWKTRRFEEDQLPESQQSLASAKLLLVLKMLKEVCRSLLRKKLGQPLHHALSAKGEHKPCCARLGYRREDSEGREEAQKATASG